MNRQKCTKENPMPKDAIGNWEHEGAYCYDSSDTIDYYICKDCGQKWKIYYD